MIPIATYDITEQWKCNRFDAGATKGTTFKAVEAPKGGKREASSISKRTQNITISRVFDPRANVGF